MNDMVSSITVGHASEFMERRSRVLRIGDLELALFKLSDGSFRAVENSCPHKGGKLADGMVCDHHVYCPLHDWKIDMNDGKVQAPDEGCVATFSVDVDEVGNVIVHFNANTARSKVS